MYRNTNQYSFARKKREKKRYKKPVLFAIVLSVGIFFVLTRAGSQDPVQQTAESPAELGVNTTPEDHPLSAVEFPKEGQYAVGTLFEGTVKTNETGESVPIASIAKVITALVVLDKSPIEAGENGDTITLQAKDENYYWEYVAVQGTVTGVTAGLEMSQYDILQTMLLASSNNMSDTLVDHYFGSVEEYVETANAFLLREGFKSTRVADATGFKPGSVSTPSELVKIGQLALRNSTIAEIASKEKATVAVAGEIPNYNSLIDEPNVTGLKPGFTDEAGSTLLYTADIPLKNGEVKTVIGVTLAHQDKPRFYNDTVSVLNQMRALYTN